MEKIMSDYEDLKKDARFEVAKKRAIYLHDKLSHIKSLIHAFDSVRENSRPNAACRDRDRNSRRIVSHGLNNQIQPSPVITQCIR